MNAICDSKRNLQNDYQVDGGTCELSNLFTSALQLSAEPNGASIFDVHSFYAWFVCENILGNPNFAI